MPTAEPKSDPLRLTRCMRCGYWLLNLPDEGVCPECGLAYDPGLVVFYGVGCKFRSLYDPTGSWGSVLLLLGYVAMQVPGGWNRFQHGDWTGLVEIAGWTGMFAAVVGWRLLARRATGGNMLQCRFNSFGCLQCPLPEQITGLTDPNRLTSACLFAFFGVLLLDWAAHMTGRWPWVLLALGVVGATGLWWFERIKSRRLQRRASPAAQVLMVAGARFAPTPWAGVRGVSIQPIKSRPGRYRLILGDVINAEVDCTGEQATALWTRVCAWRAAAGVPIQAGVLIEDRVKGGRGFPVLPPRRVDR